MMRVFSYMCRTHKELTKMKRKIKCVAVLVLAIMLMQPIRTSPTVALEGTVEISYPNMQQELPLIELLNRASPLVLDCDLCENCHITTASTLGASGAPWMLNSCGTVMVGEGINNRDGGWFSPWASYSEYVHRITFTGLIDAGTSVRGLFSELHQLTHIEGLHHLNTDNVVDMSFMFGGTINLSSLTGLNNWNTGSVTNMNGMFSNTGLISLNLTGWDTSQVARKFVIMRG